MSRIGPYRVDRELGRGGMGVVYLAHDTRLDRRVALKAIPVEVASDPERLARFEREARMLAALNHPNIGAIYDVVESEGRRYLALEHVEGETLAERLSPGALPVSEAVEICRQIATGIEAAHERGVIHRDLKPANVMITPEDQVKIVDFGLAKGTVASSTGLESPVSDSSPTLTSPAFSPGTVPGMILGTAPYLSPEQARGKPVDRRTDIWSFGCVLYECLTGRVAFRGETVSDTIAAILKQEPDWSLLPSDTPTHVRELLRRCLEKDSRKRLRDIGEARLVFEGGLTSDALVSAGNAADSRHGKWLRGALFFVAGLAAAAAVALVISVRQGPSQAPLRKFRIAVSEEPRDPVISPDGRRVAYVTKAGLWVQSLDELQPRRLAEDDAVNFAFWSPDSRSVGYVVGSRILRVPASGGQSRLVCDVGQTFAFAPNLRLTVGSGCGASWGEDETIVYTLADSTGVRAVSAGGGDSRTLLMPDSTAADFHDLSALPAGRGFLLVPHVAHHQNASAIQVWAQGKRKDLLILPDHTVDDPVYSPSGHIVFHRDDPEPGIWALPFSLSGLKATGQPFLVDANGTRPSISRDGSLCYVAMDQQPVRVLGLVTRDGKDLGPVGRPEGSTGGYATLSPDGGRAARDIRDGLDEDIWIYDIARGSRSRLTFAPENEMAPAWSPDGRRVVYFAAAAGWSRAKVLIRSADGTGPTDTLASGYQPMFSPDGKYITFSLNDDVQRTSVWAMRLEGDRTPFTVVEGHPRATVGNVAPSGDFMAYMSNESGRMEVYLARFPSGQRKWQVSVEGGQWPRWNGVGNRLYYMQAENMMEVSVLERSGTEGVVPILGTPVRLFTVPTIASIAFDVSRDGSRFLILRRDASDVQRTGVTLVENWFAEFRGR